MKVDEDNPPIRFSTPSSHSFERGLSPWHRDAFPKEFQHLFPSDTTRQEGYFELDYWGNPVAWIPDGTEMEED